MPEIPVLSYCFFFGKYGWIQKHWEIGDIFLDISHVNFISSNCLKSDLMLPGDKNF